MKQHHIVSRIAIYLLSVVLFTFGLFHFLHPRDLLVYVPAFVPGGIWWVYFVGAAFMLMAISFLTNRMVKVAADLLAIRNVEVKRERGPRGHSVQRPLLIVRPDIVAERCRRGIARIPRNGPFNQLGKVRPHSGRSRFTAAKGFDFDQSNSCHPSMTPNAPADS